MSYDLFVFDPAGVPRERAAFLDWFNEQVEDGECYFVGSSNCLKAWYDAMLSDWPDMQEADEEAYEATRRLAVETGAGFYDVSGDEGDGEIYFPGDHQRPASIGAWRQISADFKSGDPSKYTGQTEAPKRRWWDIIRRTK